MYSDTECRVNLNEKLNSNANVHGMASEDNSLHLPVTVVYW